MGTIDALGETELGSRREPTGASNEEPGVNPGPDTAELHLARFLGELPSGASSSRGHGDRGRMAGEPGPSLDADDDDLGRLLQGARRVLEDAVPLAPRRGQALGRYVVLGELGRGGMGTVLKAYDESLDRAVAIKLLHGAAAERHAPRLRREAQALAKLSHPNIVHVYEVGEDDGQWFLAMELVPGQTLRQWQQSASRSWRDCVRAYLQAGEGLAAAHSVGLVHRDFKPDNGIIDDEGRPRVLDFGLVGDARLPTSDELVSSGSGIRRCWPRPWSAGAAPTRPWTSSMRRWRTLSGRTRWRSSIDTSGWC